VSDHDDTGGPAGNNGEEGDDEERIELTPEQEQALRITMASIKHSLTPKIKLPTYALSKSALKNIAAISRIAQTQQALVANALKPILDAQSVLKKQFDGISSDIFERVALDQSNLNLIASKLTTNIDFSAIAAASRIAGEFAARQSTWLEHLGPAIAAMRASFYPPNLRAIEGIEFEEVEKVIMVDGIPLYGVPRTVTAEALVRADGASKRRDILGRRWKSISADCRTAIERCSSEAVAPYSPVAVAALDALDAGHTAAAQALAGSLVDAILSSYFGKDRYKYTPSKNGTRTKDAYDEFGVRRFIAFAPMWQAYQKFFVEDGDNVPTTFSRNATAHTVSPRQFNRRNAVQGLMFVCSLLCRLDEEARALEEAEAA
jgi:hypothetical protein